MKMILILLLTCVASFAIITVLLPPGNSHNPPGHTLGRHMLR